MGAENYWTRRRMSRRSWLRGAGLGLAGLAGAALVGCGSSSTTSTATPAAAAATSATSAGGGAATVTATAVAAAAQKAGGQLNVAIANDASSLDPQTGNSGGDAYFWKEMFDTLIGLDQQYQAQPALSLAEKWEVPDKTTITFHLRQGVKFHDGTDFNSQVVKYNVQRVQDPKLASTARSSLLVIDSVDTPDDYTATFHLKNPDSALIALLGDRGGAMVSPTAVEKYGKEFGSHPVGTGAFSFVDWVTGSNVTMKKNPSWWRKSASGSPLPYLDGVKMQIISDATASLAALTSGQVDISGVAPQNIPQVEKNSSLNMVKREGSGIVSLFAFNQTMAPVTNVDFRRAICYAVDPAAVNKAVYFDRNIVAKGGAWPVGTWVYQDVPNRPHYDPEQAKKYLAQANVPAGTKVPIVTWGPTNQQVAEAYQQQLKQVGIDITIAVQQVGQATSAFFQDHKFPLYFTGWSLYPEPDWIASLVYAKDGYYNAAKEASPQLETLIQQGREEYDQAKRKAIYEQVNEIVLGQAIFVPMLYGVSYVGTAKKVQGIDSLFGGDAKWQFQELSLT